jgi:hypothetical protein
MPHFDARSVMGGITKEKMARMVRALMQLDFPESKMRL